MVIKVSVGIHIPRTRSKPKEVCKLSECPGPYTPNIAVTKAARKNNKSVNLCPKREGCVNTTMHE
jgi:hypothetical protein